MRHLLTSIAAVIVLLSGSALSQDYYKAKIFGGYSYLNIDTNGLTSRQDLNGWEASVDGNANRWVGVEGDVSGYYKTYLGVRVSDYAFAGGPRINIGPAFVHTLFGMDSLTGSALGLSASQNSFAGLFGSGLEYPTAKRWAVRVSADYAFTHHNILGGPRVLQNNFRVSGGLVFKFGPVGPKTAANQPPSGRAAMPQRTAAVAIPSLGVQVVPRDGYGAEVAAVSDGGPAQAAGIHVGDLINNVDGTAVRTPADLGVAFANRSAGTQVKVGYLISGKWQSQTTVVLGGGR